MATRSTRLWTSDGIVESKLKGLSANYKIAKGVPVSQIDIEASRKNNARLSDSYNEELAMEYAIAMESGDRFPMVILCSKEKDGQYLIMSGNHRVGAAILAERPKVAAYIVDGNDDQVCEVLIRSANRWMGDRQSKEEAVEHAQVLINKYGMDQRQAAQLFGLRESWLNHALKAEGTREKLAKMLVDSTSIPRSVLALLAKLNHNEKIFRKAGHLTSRYTMSTSRVGAMVREVSSQPDESSSLRVLTSWEGMLSDENPKSGLAGFKLIDASKLRRHINTLTHFITTGRKGKSFDTLRQLKITKASDRQGFQELWWGLRSLMNHLFEEDTATIKVSRKPSASPNKTTMAKRTTRKINRERV